MIAALLCALAYAAGLSNPSAVCQMADVVAQTEQEYGLPQGLLVALIEVETRWSPSCMDASPSCISKGNVGLAQIQPRFSGSRANKSLHREEIEKLTREDLLLPDVSIHTSGRLLRVWMDDYQYSLGSAVCSYNAGGRACQDERGSHYRTNVSKVYARMWGKNSDNVKALGR